MSWIKLRDHLPINSAREVRIAYLRADGSIKDYETVSTGEVLNKYMAIYGQQAATSEQSETLWQYADVTAAH